MGIHDLLVSTPYFSQLSQLPQPRVILPYGWIYSSKSTREFWSRWSRPAMQLIRYLFYYPLGGRRNWYVSIPVTFLLNASGHFDLSYALVGDKSEVYWIAFFWNAGPYRHARSGGRRIFCRHNRGR